MIKQLNNQKMLMEFLDACKKVKNWAQPVLFSLEEIFSSDFDNDECNIEETVRKMLTLRNFIAEFPTKEKEMNHIEELVNDYILNKSPDINLIEHTYSDLKPLWKQVLEYIEKTLAELEKLENEGTTDGIEGNENPKWKNLDNMSKLLDKIWGELSSDNFGRNQIETQKFIIENDAIYKDLKSIGNKVSYYLYPNESFLRCFLPKVDKFFHFFSPGLLPS